MNVSLFYFKSSHVPTFLLVSTGYVTSQLFVSESTKLELIKFEIASHFINGLTLHITYFFKVFIIVF